MIQIASKSRYKYFFRSVFLIFFVLVLIHNFWTYVIGPLSFQESDIIGLEIDLINLIFALSGAILLIGFVFKESFLNYLKIKHVPLNLLVLCCLGAILFSIGLDYLFDLLGPLSDKDYSIELPIDSYELLLYSFLLIVLGPVVEEIFFRGAIYQELVSLQIDIRLIIIITSLIWSIYHYQYDIIEQTYIFFQGCLLGYARYKTRSIVTPLCMHFSYNIWFLLVNL